jgi:hypothetical protein
MAALGLYVAAIGYARSYITDGVVPDEFLQRASRNSDAVSSLRKAKLIEKMRGSRWRIHDYFAYNPSAEEVAREQQLNKARQQRFRRRQQGDNSAHNAVTLPLGERRSNASVTLDPRSTIHDPRSTIHDPGASTVGSVAPPSGVPTREQRPDGRDAPNGVRLSASRKYELSREPAADANYAVLVRLIHAVMDVERTSDPTHPDLIEAVKVAAARAGIKYPHGSLGRALRSAGIQRLNGLTPPKGPLGPLVDVVRTSLAKNTLSGTLREMAKRGRR